MEKLAPAATPGIRRLFLTFATDYKSLAMAPTSNLKVDVFQSPDYFQLDELLTEEHKLIRDSVRNYVKKEISPLIEDYAQKAEFPQQIVRQLGELGCFGPTIPEQYGGAVLIISVMVL